MAVLFVLGAYLLGSISISFLYGKLVKGIDIRTKGSGNAGATNTLRVLGLGPAILVLTLDILKGIVAVLLPSWFGFDDPWLDVWCSIAVISGHNWPIFFGFKGGKGIATTIGVAATLMFWPAFYCGVIAILSIVFTRYVSLGSLIFTGLLPISIAIFDGITPYFGLSLFIAVFAYVRHRSNIVKLAKGQEHKLGMKR